MSTVALWLLAWSGSAFALTGAIFTTESDGTVVNLNLYDFRTDVYLNGGPQNQNSAGLPDGTYYFQVTDPSGAVLLSTDSATCRQLQVVNGRVAGATGSCQHSNGTFNQANGSTPVQLAPFDFTPNQGGEYKAWLIAQTNTTSIDPIDDRVLIFNNSDTKTDNFKVRESEQCPNPPDCALPLGSSISGIKFYDANANGIKDSLEPGISGWKIELFGDATSNTTTGPPLPAGDYAFLNLDAGTYGVCEIIPALAPVWVSTTPTSITNIVVPPDSTDNDFGNVCLGSGGGLTLGFWSNKNGQALFGSDDLALMVSLNLRNANGSDFNPGNYAAFRTWLLSATATNMAYMLSAQLAAMELNVLNGKVNDSSIVFAPGCGDTSLNSNANFITINQLRANANTQLGAHGLTTEASDPTNRAIQECLKNALDAANNNRNFVQSAPCTVNYSGLEVSCAP